MDMKKRLTELCRDAAISCGLPSVDMPLIAEYLARNGVIALPCNIGTTIYELTYEKEDPCSWCNHDHSGFGDYICDLDYDHYPQVKDFINGEKICPKFQMKITEFKFDLWFYHSDKDWFNITWFLTKEEAEKALEGMKGR